MGLTTVSISDNRRHSRMSLFESIAFVFVFIMPFFFYATSSKSSSATVQYLAVVVYALMFMINPKYLNQVFKGESALIIGAYILGVFLKTLAHAKFSTMGVLMPIVAFYGYYYLESKRIRLIVFDALLIGLYIYFVYTFYLNLPSLFFRAQLAEEMDYFGTSSSNAIPIILINVLYIYQVVAYLQKEDRNRRFLVFSSINLILVLIQGSRAGILVAMAVFCYNLFVVGKQSKNVIVRTFPVVVISTIVVFIIKNAATVYEYADQINALESDVYAKSRGYYVQLFFERMNFESFLFGYPPGLAWGDETYTFNVFLEQWNTYTLFGLCVTLCVLFRRFLFYKRYYFPCFFLVPFLLYSFSEPRYLPNFWDFFIYLMLFKRKELIPIKS